MGQKNTAIPLFHTEKALRDNLRKSIRLASNALRLFARFPSKLPIYEPRLTGRIHDQPDGCENGPQRTNSFGLKGRSTELTENPLNFRRKKMPEKETIERAKQDEAGGKSPSTQAGEFVREEIHHVREGVHGARSVQQAIAIGLSKARRAGVRLPPPKKGAGSGAVRRQAQRDLAKAGTRQKVSRKRSQATLAALRREGHGSASHDQLAAQARSSSRRRGPAARHRASIKAARTKGPLGLRRARRKAAMARGKSK